MTEITLRQGTYTLKAKMTITDKFAELTMTTADTEKGWESSFHIRFISILSNYTAYNKEEDKSIIHFLFAVAKGGTHHYNTDYLTAENAKLLVQFITKDTWIEKAEAQK